MTLNPARIAERLDTALASVAETDCVGFTIPTAQVREIAEAIRGLADDAARLDFLDGLDRDGWKDFRWQWSRGKPGEMVRDVIDGMRRENEDHG